MAKHAESDGRIQVGGDADTAVDACLMCAARATVDARVVRAGVTRMTIVVDYARPRFGPCAVQTSSAMLCIDDEIVVGKGASIEEAIVHALDSRRHR